MAEEEDEGITGFISNLFGGEKPKNVTSNASTNATVTTNTTTASVNATAPPANATEEEEGVIDFISSFIWDDDKKNKTTSNNTELEPSVASKLSASNDPPSFGLNDYYNQLK